MLKIGLTGGIGSGKSTVAKYFAKLKVPIIDADKVAHELTKPGTTPFKKIITRFGKSFLTPKKALDRRKLRETIFTHKKERIWLENLLHPLIRTAMEKLAAKTTAPYCIMIIPLLFETKSPINVDRILVVDCPKTTQIRRSHKRDNSTVKQLQAIIKAQTKRQIRLQKASDVIHNTGTLEHLKKEVKKLHHNYLRSA